MQTNATRRNVLVDGDGSIERWILVRSHNNQGSAADAGRDEDCADAGSPQDNAGLVHAELAFDLESAACEQHCAAKTVNSCGESGNTIERTLNEGGIVGPGGFDSQDGFHLWYRRTCLIARIGKVDGNGARQWVK
jgi:hypothetical protein